MGLIDMAITGYLMWKVGVHWLIWVIYVSAVVFNVGYGIFKAGKEIGEENGKDL